MASKLDLQAFYPGELNIVKIDEEEQRIILTLKSTKHEHCCPSCHQEMNRYHGTYTRTVQDLPIFQKSVTLRIHAYDYYCTNVECSAITFAEDYDGFVGRSGRMTTRLEALIRALALETNCEGAATICKEMGIRISGDTIIRLLRKLAEQPRPPCGDTIGVDDFAYRKGRTYCTLICDGTTHAPIDILDGRDGQALSEWLKQNKQVKRVTRDRAGAYARAITEILPDAMQIADRFHLYQNLLQAVKEALKLELPSKIAISREEEGSPATTAEAKKKS